MNENDRSKITFQIHPCTEDGLVTIEAKLYLGSPFGRPGEDFFDTKQMCSALKRLWFLDSLRCSEEMGYALAEWEGKRIHVFKGGKIIIRKAKDDEDAKKTLDIIGRTLWATIPCSCGKPLVYCASGACDECSAKVCKIHAYPPFVELPESSSQIKGGEVLDFVENVEAKDHFKNAFEKLDEYVSVLRGMDEKMVKKDFAGFDSLVDKAEETMEEACGAGTRYMIETPKDHHAALGIVFLGLAEDLWTLMDAMRLMKDVGYEVEEYNAARDIAFDSYGAFVSNDADKVTEVIERFHKFLREKHTKPIIVLARAGHHMARMTTKPFPV
ncbi:MAG: hypothetical protein KAW09_08480 [Thermoplasmata archaeon]|nr:hypothetical protein [Thermoplasmata archaeon]